MKQIDTDTLCLLLRYALDRMRQPGSEIFQNKVDKKEHPDYYDVVFNPMDFATLENVSIILMEHWFCENVRMILMEHYKTSVKSCKLILRKSQKSLTCRHKLAKFRSL